MLTPIALGTVGRGRDGSSALPLLGATSTANDCYALVSGRFAGRSRFVPDPIYADLAPELTRFAERSRAYG